MKTFYSEHAQDTLFCTGGFLHDVLTATHMRRSERAAPLSAWQPCGSLDAPEMLPAGSSRHTANTTPEAGYAHSTHYSR